MVERCVRDAEVAGSNPVTSTTSEQVSLVPIFLCKKISHLLHCSSFFVKRHARLTCSLVNALTTVRCRYHLFTSVPSARKWHLNHSLYFECYYKKCLKTAYFKRFKQFSFFVRFFLFPLIYPCFFFYLLSNQLSKRLSAFNYR